jgi:hypothetical protein
LFLIYPKKREDCGHKLQAIFADVELFGCDPSEPVKLLYPHKRSADGKAQDKATSVLSSEHLSCISPKVKPCLRSCVGRRVALQFSGYKDLRPVASRVFPSLRVADEANVQPALRRGTLNRLVGLCQWPSSSGLWSVIPRKLR